MAFRQRHPASDHHPGNRTAGLPATADEDRLRLHHALAWDYGLLGGYTHALQHATEELSYRRRLQRPDHPDVLNTRASIAIWTGEHGDAAGALQLSVPPSLDFPGAAALPAAIETATRVLDQLGVGSGSTLLINGASGSVGSAAVQLAVARGARVIGAASPANHDYLRSLGAEPVAYGEGLGERVRALAPVGVDAALDVAGSGVLPELIELAGAPEHVVTIADFGGAQEHGVRFSSGDAGRAVHALAEIGELIESGRFSLPVAQTFPLAEIADAHRVSEDGHVRGKLVLLVG